MCTALFQTHLRSCSCWSLVWQVLLIAVCASCQHKRLRTLQQQLRHVDCLTSVAHLAERLRAARAGSVRACYVMADSADELLREVQLILHVAVLVVAAATASHFS
jgi:hypothetical protein